MLILYIDVCTLVFLNSLIILDNLSLVVLFSFGDFLSFIYGKLSLKANYILHTWYIFVLLMS